MKVLIGVDPHKVSVAVAAVEEATGELLLNELWNYGFFGMRSTLAGFLGMVVFLVALKALIVALRAHERSSAGLLVPYYLWVLYDLAWTYELWRLSGAA